MVFGEAKAKKEEETRQVYNGPREAKLIAAIRK